jgi:PAS domain S-box-containing protein
VVCSEPSALPPDRCPDASVPRPGAEPLPLSIEFLRAVVDTIADPVFVKDEHHRLVLVNDAECRLAGRSREALLGNAEVHLTPEQQRIFWLQDDHVMATGESLVLEDPLEHPEDGLRIYQTRKSRLVLPGGERFLVGITRDVTGLRQAERANRRMATAVAQSPNGIVMMEPDGRIEYVNAAFECNTGFAAAEVMGRSARELLNPEADPALDRELFGTVRAGKTWSGRITNQDREGQPLVVDTVFSPILDESGRIDGYVVAGRDITRQVAIEERAAQSGRLEAIGTLAGGIAHDFNNLLTAIMGYTELARARLASSSPEWCELGAALQGCHRAAELVRQILVFSRRSVHEAVPVQVAPIVEEALGLLRASLPASIEIRRQLRSNARVLADPGELHRVLVNLGTNSALAMRERGGVLEVALDDLVLDADTAVRHAVAPGAHVRLRVSDSGCGMSREVAARVFEPFFTTRRPGEGTGMGLAVVHGIVTRARGSIAVESEPGCGSTFEILLPHAAAGRDRAPESVEAIPGRGERIVLVDDDAMVLECTAVMLRELGYAVRAHGEAARALEEIEARAEDVDLLLTDYSMPRMNGEELIGRARRVRPDLPVVLFSGCCEEDPGERARRLGIEALVMKPLRAAELARLLRDVFDARRQAAASAGPGAESAAA